MKRALFIVLVACLVFGMITPVMGDLLMSCSPLTPCTPVPPAHPPNDRDGDGTPDGLDKCPDQGGPASNSGCPLDAATPTPAPALAAPPVTLPTMPTTGDCVLATRTADPVNIHFEPSINARIVGVLDPQKLYPVIAQTDNAEGLWDRIVPGWVAGRVVRLGGDCETVPKLDEPGATDPTPNWLSFPNGFGLALDKGDAPGQDTPQGYCSPAFGINVADANGLLSSIHFAFGDGSVSPAPTDWCVTFDTNGQGFGLEPPPDPDRQPFSAHWSVGFNADNPAELLLIALLNFNPGQQAPPDPDKSGMQFTWRLFPPDPCKPGDASCASQPANFALNWSLLPPDPCKPGDQSCPGQPPNFAVSWSLLPPDPCKQSCANPGAGTQGVFVTFLPAVQNPDIYFSDRGFEYGGLLPMTNQPGNTDVSSMYGFTQIEDQALPGQVTVNFRVAAVQ